jgi:glycosyltransferase involved in cell wall biosynthesis
VERAICSTVSTLVGQPNSGTERDVMMQQQNLAPSRGSLQDVETADRMGSQPRILALFGARVFFGQERANVEALAALRDRGCEILCAVRHEDWSELIELRKELSARSLCWKKFYYIDIPRKGWVLKTILRNPYAFARANIEMIRTMRCLRISHIHAFNPFFFLNFMPIIMLSRIPVIYRCGDEPPQHNRLWRALWSYICRRVDHFVADSNFIRDKLLGFDIDLRKISVIYSPAPRRPMAAAARIPESAGADKVFRFVYAGQLTPEKGVDVLVQAFSRSYLKFEFAHLLIAGRISDWSGDDWARALRDDVACDRSLGTRVHFLGWVDNVPDLMRQCHVHVCPSKWEEPYGLVAVEAKSAGIPSIIFPSGGLKELVEHGINGWVTKSKTVDELSDALEYYLRNPEIAEAQGRNARKSLDALQLDSFSERWLDVYRQTPARHSAK